MTFLLLWSLRAVGVVLVGLTLAAVLRGRSAATRNLVLRIALAVAWLVPLAAAFAPRVEVPIPAPAIAPAVPNVPRTFHEPTPITEGWSVVQPDPKDLTTLGLQRVTPFSTQIVPTPFPFFLLWGAGFGLLVLRWIRGIETLLRLRRAAEPTDAPDVWRATIAVPATYGRTILVPLASGEWPEARLQAAILHERAHVARRDWHWQTLAALFAAVHWINPLAWLLARALRDSAEAAADDAVLAQGVAPSAYARELLAVAASVGPTGPALAMARRGGVKDRVVAILAERDRRRPTRRAGGILLATILGVGIVAAGVTGTREGGVRLLDLTDHTGKRWDRTGHELPATTAPVGDPVGIVTRGQRWVTMRFDLGDSPKSRGIDIKVASPAQTNGFGPTDTQGQPVWLSITAPPTLRQTGVRVGLAEGDWHEVPGSAKFRRTIERVIGAVNPQYILALDFPVRYRDEQVRVVARLRDGTEPKRIGSGEGHTDSFIKMHGSPEASIQIHGRPQDLASAHLEHRPYRWTTFLNVRLRPTSSVKPPRLVGLLENARDGMRAWKPDGTPLTTLDPTRPNGASFPVPPRVLDMSKPARRLWLAFDVDAPNGHPSRDLPQLPSFASSGGSLRVARVAQDRALVFADIVVSSVTIETIDLRYLGVSFPSVRLRPRVVANAVPLPNEGVRLRPNP